jgi:serine/threonine-protein kinase
LAEESRDGKDARKAWINQVVAGRYEVLEAVGESPLLWVFRVRDQKLNRIVALKLLRGDVSERETWEARLTETWGRALALKHPHIAVGHDLVLDPERGLCGLTEEFIRGLDLRERIRRAAPFSNSVAVEIAQGVATALDQAHQKGIVHGDLKAEHILLPADGSGAKLTGFGEGAEAAHPADDLIGVGKVLSEMLTGEAPVRDKSGWGTPRRLNKAIPRALEGVILKALSGEYESARALASDLKAVHVALQTGDSLGWSPQDVATGKGVSLTEQAAKKQETSVAAPIRRVSRPMRQSPPTEPADEETSNVKSPPRRVGIGRWFVSFNLLLLLSLGVLAWYLTSMVMKIMIPPGEVVVPDLVGKTLEEAERLGRKAKFEVVENETKHQVNFPAGTIYMQVDQKGMKVREGHKIPVGISLGPLTVVVPGVTEMTLEKAKKELDKVGLRLGQTTYRYESYIAKGNVVEQEPAAGERRPKGGPINLVVSKGEEPTPEPTAEPTPEPTPEPIEETPGGGDAPPDENPPPVTPAEPVSRTRSYSVPELPYVVPRDGRPHRIRIDVVDDDGQRTEYDALHEPGESVQASVTVTGKATIRLYDNDTIKGEATPEEKPRSRGR